jgi:hypothetical protein
MNESPKNCGNQKNEQKEDQVPKTNLVRANIKERF